MSTATRFVWCAAAQFRSGTEFLAARGLQFKEIDLGGDTNLFVESVQQSLSMSVGVARG